VQAHSVNTYANLKRQSLPRRDFAPWQSIAELVDALIRDLACQRARGRRLARHKKGDRITVAGELRRNHYTGRDGEERVSWNLTADGALSAQTSKPRSARPRQSRSRSSARRPRREPVLEPPEDRVDDIFAEGPSAMRTIRESAPLPVHRVDDLWPVQ